MQAEKIVFMGMDANPSSPSPKNSNDMVVNSNRDPQAGLDGS